MKNFFKKSLVDKTVFWIFLGSLILIFLNLAYMLFSYTHLPPLIPLFNQMPWGQSRLGTKEQIFIPILIALLVFINNFTLSTTMYEKTPLLSRILSITSLSISFLTLLFSIRTVQIII